jgi:hypothetical protein
MSKTLKTNPAKLEGLLKKEFLKQGKTRVEDLKMRGFLPKNRTGDRRENWDARPNDRNSNGQSNDRNRNDGNWRCPNDRVREIEDVDASPPVEEEATASEDISQAAAAEEPTVTPPSIPDTCNSVDHLDDEDTEDDESSFSSGDSFDDSLCIFSSSVCHISEIDTVEDVADGDEENEDESLMESLVDETEMTWRLTLQTQENEEDSTWGTQTEVKAEESTSHLLTLGREQCLWHFGNGWTYREVPPFKSDLGKLLGQDTTPMLSRYQTPMEKPESATELEELAMEDYDASGLFCVNGIIPEFEEVCETVDIQEEGR